MLPYPQIVTVFTIY